MPARWQLFHAPGLGSGAALFDFDGDGAALIFSLLQNGGPQGKSNRLIGKLPGGRFRT